MNSFRTFGGIFLEGCFMASNLKISILNVYGPYNNREFFWNNLENSGVFEIQNLIVAKDLNFTLSTAEIWGSTARIDPLSYFFTIFLKWSKLLDITPIKLGPIWSNGRSSETAISKILNRFILKESMASSLKKYRTWEIKSNSSDHFPIVLPLEYFISKRHYPFKFNNMWIKDEGFCSMV